MKSAIKREKVRPSCFFFSENIMKSPASSRIKFLYCTILNCYEILGFRFCSSFRPAGKYSKNDVFGKIAFSFVSPRCFFFFLSDLHFPVIGMKLFSSKIRDHFKIGFWLTWNAIVWFQELGPRSTKILDDLSFFRVLNGREDRGPDDQEDDIEQEKCQKANGAATPHDAGDLHPDQSISTCQIMP